MTIPPTTQTLAIQKALMAPDVIQSIQASINNIFAATPSTSDSPGVALTDIQSAIVTLYGQPVLTALETIQTALTPS